MSVAKTYAKALFESASESKLSVTEIDELESQLTTINKVFSDSREARVILMGPVVSSKEKAKVLNEISKQLKFSALLCRFLVLLATKERLGLLEQILDSFRHVRLESEGGVLGKIISADQMDVSDRDSLAQSFTKRLGKRVLFSSSVDSELLAGMKVIVNGVTYDGTLRSQLQRLRDHLVLGA